MNIISTITAAKILEQDPSASFYLNPIKVPYVSRPTCYLIAGYHIFTSNHEGTIKVVGKELWDYVIYNPVPNT